MRRRPSPSLILSIIAIVLALGGTSVAAITFVKNAGAVDGFSAVGSRSSTHHAANKLVAASSSGKIPQRFIDTTGLFRGAHSSFHQSIDVVDNGSAAPVAISGIPGIGTLSATCEDQNAKAGTEDPKVTIALANTSGSTLNVDRWVGGNQPASVTAVGNGAQDAFSINNSNTFSDDIELNGAHLVINGVFRQDGTAAAGTCTVYGYTLAIPA